MVAVEGPGRGTSRSLIVLGAVGGVVLLLASALAGTALGGSVALSPPSSSAHSPSSHSTAAVSHSFPTPIQHVVVVMEENKDYTTVLANGSFQRYLAQTYATATNFYAVDHDSVNAYEGATSATATRTPSLSVPNIGDLADAAGISWAAFEEGMPAPCYRSPDNTTGYVIIHNPFVMYTDITSNASRCKAHDLTWSSWTDAVNAGSIPNYAFITPNTTNDCDNSPDNNVSACDVWLQNWLSPLLNDSAIASTTAFIITYDEDAGYLGNTPVVNGTKGGHVYTVIVSPYSHRLESNVFYNTFSLLTTAEWLLGLPGGTLGSNDTWTWPHAPMQQLFRFPVSFTESGLPSGSSWSVTVNGTTESSTTSRITFTEPVGTYNYTATVAGSGSTNGTFTLTGASLTVPLRFYPVTFQETGLASGTGWSVTINAVTGGATTASIGFSLANGTYSFGVSAIPGYSVSPASGQITVKGAAVAKSIVFTPIRATYPVNFTETGLPSGTSWSVTLNGTLLHSTGTSVATVEPNGTYPYTVGAVAGYGATPASGSVTVGGTSVSVAITFSPVPSPRYAVTFTENGLPSGTLWSVSLSGSANDSTGSSISFHEPNGTYAFTVGAVPGYSASPASSTVIVVGGPQSVSITFAPAVPPRYALTFAETGLPSGTNWSVTVNGTTRSSTTPTIEFDLPNGSAAFTVVGISGYAATPSAGAITVGGASLSVPVAFASVFELSFTETGLSAGSNWSVALTGRSPGVILLMPLAGTDTVTQVRWSGGTPTVVFYATNGTYNYTASAPGYPSLTGEVTVAGAAVAHGPLRFGSSGSSSGLPMSDIYLIAGVVVALIAGVLVAVLLRRRGGGRRADRSSRPGATDPPGPPAGK